MPDIGAAFIAIIGAIILTAIAVAAIKETKPKTFKYIFKKRPRCEFEGCKESADFVILHTTLSTIELGIGPDSNFACKQHKDKMRSDIAQSIGRITTTYIIDKNNTIMVNPNFWE